MCRTFVCPKCGATVRFPTPWMLGVEVVFPCPECGCRFRTGYRMGALLFALALVLALATANLGVWLFSSYSLPLFVALVVPLWLLYGFWLRRGYFRRKWRKKEKK